MIEPLNMPEELQPYGWYVSSTERPDRYMRQDLSLKLTVDTNDSTNGGYFETKTKAILARAEYYKKHNQESKAMSKEVNIEDVIGGALERVARVAGSVGGCGCADIDKENKFLGQVYDHNGNFVETLHAEKKSEFKEYLSNPDNIGRRVLVYKGKMAYSSDVPVNTHKMKKKESKQK